MSKVINPYGTDNVLKKKFAKNIIEALYGKTDLKKIYNILTDKNPNDIIFALTNELFNEMFFTKNPKEYPGPSAFEKKIYRVIPEDYSMKKKGRLKVAFEIIKNNAILQLYNYGKVPRNLKGKLYKSVKNIFKDREHQKEIVKLLNNPEITVNELSGEIYSTLKKEGCNFNEISMKIKDINQILRIKRIKEISEGKKDTRIKVFNLRNFLWKFSSHILDTMNINKDYKNIRKIKNIIKSYSTYSLNMPLARKLKKEFPSISYDKIKIIAQQIKSIANNYNLEESILNEKIKKVFDREIIRDIQKRDKGEKSLEKKFNEIIDNYFKGRAPEDFLMDSEHKTMVKTFDFHTKNFLKNRRNKDYNSPIYTYWDMKYAIYEDSNTFLENIIPMFKDPSALFFAYLKNKISKNEEKELIEYIKKIKNLLNNQLTENKSDDWIRNFVKKHIKDFEEPLSSFKEIEDFFIKNIMKDMNTKDAVSFPIFYEIFKIAVEKSNLDEVNFLKNFEFSVEYVQRIFRKSMLMGSLSREEDALGKKILEYLYNYYYGFLFKEEKFWEKIPYFISTEFLKAIRNIAFKNNIKIDKSLINQFKKKYALKILSKIEHIEKKDVRAIMQKFNQSEKFSYSFKNFTPYTVSLSGEKINREFVENLEDFFYLNVETYNLPSYDSLVSLSREYGKENINKALDSSINNIKEKISKRNFQEEYFNVMKNGDGLFYKTYKADTSIFRRMIFYNFDQVKEFINKAVKEIKIDLPEYNINNLENFINKVKISIKEDVDFAPNEIEILKKAEKIAKEHADISGLKAFIKKAGWKNDETFNFIAVFKRRLESLISLYPEEKTKDLNEFSFMLEKYLRGWINEENLTRFLSETFFVEGENIRDAFISLSKNLKESINTVEIRAAFLIEDTIEDIYEGADRNKNEIEGVLKKIKNKEVREAILNFNTSALDDKYKEKVEEFLFKGNINSLKEIANIEEKQIERAKFDMAGITERNPLVKSFKMVMKGAKNLFFSDVLIDKNKRQDLKEKIAEEEIKFHNGNMIIKIDKNYVFEETEKRFLNSEKDEFLNFMKKIKEEFKEDTMELSTRKTEELLRKIFIEQKPLSSKESMELFAFAKIVYPKLALLQGTHDVIRSDGAFTFFSINNPYLREIIHNYKFESLQKVFKNSYSMLFADAKKTGLKNKFLNYAKQTFFNALMNEGFSNGLKPIYISKYKKQNVQKEEIDFNYKIAGNLWEKEIDLKNGNFVPSVNTYALSFNPNDKMHMNMSGVLEKKAPLVFSEETFKNETYKMLFENKTFDEMNKEEIRNFLLDSLIGNIKITNRSDTYSTFKNKLYSLYNEAKYSLNSLQKAITELDELSNNKDIEYKEKITESVKTAAILSGIEKQIKNFLNAIKNVSEYSTIKTNLTQILVNELKESNKEMQKILKNDIDSIIKSFKIFQKNVADIKNAIQDAIKQINKFEIAGINVYVDKIAKAGWDYKDLMFLKENLAVLNSVLAEEFSIYYSQYNKSQTNINDFYKTELKKRITIIQKIFEKETDETLKNALILYQIDQFCKSYAYGIGKNSKDIFSITGNEKSVKNNKHHLYFNTSTLSSFSTRPGELALMPESHFINRSVFGKEFNYSKNDKSKYYLFLYNFGDGYFKNRNFVNVDKLRNKIFDSYAIHFFLNDLEDIKSKKTINEIEKLTVEKYSENKIKIEIYTKNNKGLKNKKVSMVIPIKNNDIFKSAGADYFISLFRGTKIIPLNSEYDSEYPYETLLSLAEKTMRENRRIEIKNVGLYFKKYNKINLVKNLLNFYSKMNIYISRLSDKIKQDPSVYPQIIDSIKNAYESTVASEMIKIANIKESIKQKIKEIKSLKDSYPDYLLETIKKDVEKIKNSYVEKTNKKTAKIFIDYTEYIKHFNLNDKKTAKEIKKYMPYVFSMSSTLPYFAKRGKNIMTQLVRNEREFIKAISPANPHLTEIKTIAGNFKGYINTKEKRLITREEVLCGKEYGISINSEFNKTFAISDFEKEIKRMVLIKQKDFNLTEHFEKVKNEFENAYELQELAKNKNIKDIN